MSHRASSTGTTQAASAAPNSTELTADEKWGAISKIMNWQEGASPTWENCDDSLIRSVDDRLKKVAAYGERLLQQADFDVSLSNALVEEQNNQSMVYFNDGFAPAITEKVLANALESGPIDNARMAVFASRAADIVEAQIREDQSVAMRIAEDHEERKKKLSEIRKCLIALRLHQKYLEDIKKLREVKEVSEAASILTRMADDKSNASSSSFMGDEGAGLSSLNHTVP